MSSFKEEKIQKLLMELMLSGLSYQDLFNFLKEHADEFPDLVKELMPLEIVYMDHTQSFYFFKEKEPMALIVDGVGISIEGFGEEEWKTADRKCKSFLKGGVRWTLPTVEQLKLISAKIDIINEVLAKLGCSSYSRFNYCWSCERSGSNDEFLCVNLGDDGVFGCSGYKDKRFIPVLLTE